MQIFRGLENLSESARGATLVLGSFDGIHRGHAALIETARGRPHQIGVLTFSPHPRLLTQPKQPPFLLTPGDEKYVVLRELGVDFCVEIPFTRDFASTSAQDFVEDILVGRLAARHLIFGYNFRFGAGRKGDATLLCELGAKYGITTDSVTPMLDGSGNTYSSTRVREYLRAGDIAGAAAVLGRFWAIKTFIKRGAVEDGRTAHFRFGAHLRPSPAYYNVRLQYSDGRSDEAHLIVSQDDDTGRLEVSQDTTLREAEFVTIEFLGFAGPLMAPRLSSEAGAGNACYI